MFVQRKFPSDLLVSVTKPLPIGQSVPCLLQTLVIRFCPPLPIRGPWHTGQEGRSALPRGLSEAGGSGETHLLRGSRAVRAHFSLEVPSPTCRFAWQP